MTAVSNSFLIRISRSTKWLPNMAQTVDEVWAIRKDLEVTVLHNDAAGEVSGIKYLYSLADAYIAWLNAIFRGQGAPSPSRVTS